MMSGTHSNNLDSMGFTAPCIKDCQRSYNNKFGFIDPPVNRTGLPVLATGHRQLTIGSLYRRVLRGS
jgi:hypothetical protein